MKAGKILLAAAFALTLAASANAGIHVWWEAADGSIGAQGSTLNLECAAGARCEWDLKMMIGLDGAEDTVLGWAEDLLIDPSFGGIVTVKNNSLPVGTPWASLSSAGVANYGEYYGYHVLMGAYGQNAGGYIGGPLATPLLYVTLSVNGAAEGQIDVLSEGGLALWVATDGIGASYAYVDFFGETEQLSFYSYGDVRSNAAISINVVPEPTTVAFLGLGALALIRRRR